MKGIVIAGGLGTRLKPLTNTINKQLLPVYDRPLVHYPIQTLVDANINEIFIVCAKGHAGQLIEHVINEDKFEDIKFEFGIQENPTGGIAQALQVAQKFSGNDNIAVILGDNIFEDNLREDINNFKYGAKVFLKEVDNSKRFGCPKIVGNRIKKIEEKPTKPKSNYCVTGLYLYDKEVWDILNSIQPSARGQLEITDVNNWYVDEGEMDFSEIYGEWIDAGTFDSLLNASIWAKNKKPVIHNN